MVSVRAVGLAHSMHMATLADVARQRTSLSHAQVVHLQQLVAEWGFLADLSFADLLLYVPTTNGDWVVLAQVRPATARTIYVADYVGDPADSSRPLLDIVMSQGGLHEGDIDVEGLTEPARMLAIPVRYHDDIIAVLARETSTRNTKMLGELERTYVAIFERFAVMVAEGSFPSEGPLEDSSAAPRIGDGTILLDEDARVRYASPNAMSVFHRVGITANALGMRLTEMGFNDSSARRALDTRRPVIEEFDQTPEITLLSRCIPIMAGGEVTGGLLLVRDVTEVRKRDKLLLSKDATIREVHHRVKNNLQTISSLLRLQARRLQSAEAKAAVNESVRRIRTIAVVHETLSREAGDDVAFLDIVRPLLRLSEEGLQSQDRPIRFTVHGDGGRLPTTVATPLSVVLIELLQNAIDHGFPEGSSGGDVVVQLTRSAGVLSISVVNDGVGLDPTFELNKATGLGLSIVRTLVTTELGGSIVMRPGMRADFEAVGIQDVRDGTGTVVNLTVPIA
jgi:two-component system, sensor histidine kinase PdtaS